MKNNLNCPLCRARYESLQVVQDVESQIFVPVIIRTRQTLFKDFVLFSIIVFSIYTGIFISTGKILI